jgi:DMSO/TMAO reductase YedYZ molybdopterin-dependent catalytic subunit
MSADRRTPGWYGPVLGLVTAGVALGVAQAVAGWVGVGASPVVAVGQGAIDLAPPWLKEYAIRTFGTHDKDVLLAGIGVTLLVAAIVIGVATVRRAWVGWLGLGALAGVGALAVLTRPDSTPADLLPVLVGAAAGAMTLRAFLRALSDRPEQERVAADPDRRRFLVTAGVGAAVALAAGSGGTLFSRRFRADDSRASVRIPTPSSPAAPVAATLDGTEGISSYFTPNARFYRVDTALLTPAVTAEDWQLRIHGMVDREITLTYPQLLARPLIERDVTLTCVSNPVGGHYIGNARWIGAPLGDILKEAGVHRDASQLVARSVDGFTVGTPTAALLDGRDAMLAVAMNGEPLPIAHGFPVRVVVPGLYGYVSATKWLAELELTTLEAFDAYWVPRGWAKKAPILTQSRIDVPQDGSRVSAGLLAVAGVAWAPDRGVSKVEVRIDQDDWRQATLSTATFGPQTWVQWKYAWQAAGGHHEIYVRATDGTGAVQEERVTPPPPDGARGYHRISLDVG